MKASKQSKTFDRCHQGELWRILDRTILANQDQNNCKPHDVKIILDNLYHEGFLEHTLYDSVINEPHYFRWCDMGALLIEKPGMKWASTRLERGGGETWIGLRFPRRNRREPGFVCFKEPVTTDEVLDEMREFGADLPDDIAKERSFVDERIRFAPRLLVVQKDAPKRFEDCRIEPCIA